MVDPESCYTSRHFGTFSRCSSRVAACGEAASWAMSNRALLSLVAVTTGATATLYPTYKLHTFTLPPSEASKALYSQVPLDKTRNQIRLLSLHPGRQSSSIRCTLRVSSLDDNLRFTALSYTWGEPIRRSTSLWSFRGIFQYLRGLWWSLFRGDTLVNVNGEPFYLKYNLGSALQSLRHEEEEKVLWVDALCINQLDPIEKADQVARMKDIYSQAHTTCVWLGPSEDDSNTAMDFVRHSHKLDIDDPKLQLSDINPPWRAMQALFARSWWGRMWIVQELFMSKNVVVRCGEKEVEMDRFRELMQKEQRLRVRARSGQLRGYDFPRWYFVPPANPFYSLLGAWALDQESRQDPSTVQSALSYVPFVGTVVTALQAIDNVKKASVGHMGIGNWLYMTQAFESSLPRDKVYALLGLIGDEDKDAIVPDYTPEKKDVEIFKEVAAQVMRRDTKLSVLNYAQSNTRTLCGLPSWAIDLSEPTMIGPNMTQYGFSADGGFAAWARLTPDKTHKVSQQPNNALDIVSWLGKQTLYFLPVQLFLFKQGRPLIYSFTSLWHMAWYGNLGLLSYFKFGNRLEKYSPVPSFSSDLNAMHLDGLIFDEIILSDPVPDFGLFSKEDPIWMERNPSETQGFLNGIRLKHLFQRWEGITSSFPRVQPPQVSGDHPLVAFRQPEDAFWRTLIMDRFNSGSTLRKPPASMGEAYRFIVHPNATAAELQVNSRLAKARLMEKYFMHVRFLTTAVSTIADRAFVMTKHGMMALAPAQVKPGDVICIIRGGQTPFVLRPKGVSDDGERVWELVGDCYVHGIMDGSFASQAKPEDVRMFSII
ncbi:hypothetical protein BDN71DRAFT_1020537 [Pleurotus eryngii]|uniref:Heterokaryon incompatibility domain-containing protein n=1 Tax=Pleurotus eryngii TaxID=5323 RepID=A0A9P5ZV23_PLEER|nr:hypothetical protein BDN71DRAFT_1020537 [Pleurotus eryngii]